MNIDTAIEKNILGHLLYFGKTADNEAVYSILDRVEDRWFSDEKHQILYRSIVDCFFSRGKADHLHLIRHLTDTKTLELAGGSAYISKMIAERERTTDLPYLVNVFENQGKKSELMKIFSEIGGQIDTDPLSSSSELIGELEKRVNQLRGFKYDSMVDLVKEAEIVIEKANNAEKYGCYGYSWGIPALDKVTGGIESGKSYVIGATKKSGKTKFIINTIYNLRRSSVPVLFLSLEMNGESVAKELLSRFAMKNNDLLKKPLAPADEQSFQSAKKEIATGIMVDQEPSLNIMQVRQKIKHAAHEGVKVVFLDYLQRMDFQIKGSSMNYASVVASTVMQLADSAKENNVAFVFLSQLRNDAENQNADISMLKDSGGIAEGVDCIMILNNQDRINKNYTNRTNEIWINIEQRSGQSGFVKCRVDLGTASYFEIDERVNVPAGF